MDWQDHGTVLSARRHGETSAILEVFTEAHGRHAGVVRGANSRKLAPSLQPGSQIAVTWRARLEAHLGSFTVEPVQSRAGIMGDRLALAGQNAVTALLSFTLPEREAQPRLYARTVALLDMIGESDAWTLAYLHWELALLDEMGFGLDLTACAVTGATQDLSYVSPRSGRAVTEAGAGAWKERLLPLPPCLMQPQLGPPEEICAGLRTTGHFLGGWLAPALGEKPLPPARQRFVELLARQAGRPSQSRQTGPADQTGQTRQTDPAQQADQTDPARQADQTAPARQADQTAPARQADQTAPARQADQARHADQTGQS